MNRAGHVIGYLSFQEIQWQQHCPEPHISSADTSSAGEFYLQELSL